jgi:hypothetical protein
VSDPADTDRRTPADWMPPDATEHVIARFDSGAKKRSEFQQHGAVVGVALWEDDGAPCWAWCLRDDQKHGPEVEWWTRGGVAFVEHWVSGVLHGPARHFDEEGRLLLETELVHGTGVDLWCDSQSWTLSEETWLRDSRLHERRWWNTDQRTVYREELHAARDEHAGIEREWNDRGRLRRGFPQFFVGGERVDKRAYLRAAERDPALPRHLPEHDDPRRQLPSEFVRQPAHRRAQRRGRRPSTRGS